MAFYGIWRAGKCNDSFVTTAHNFVSWVLPQVGVKIMIMQSLELVYQEEILCFYSPKCKEAEEGIGNI